MSESTAGGSSDPATTEWRPGRIDAIGVRHPWRWVIIAVLAVLAMMLLNLLIFDPVFQWPFAFEAMNQAPVIRGFWIGTVSVTAVAMIVGVAVGVLLAVMRLSDNPVFRGVAAAYTWFFRAIPRYVLLVIMGALGALFPTGIQLGVPFDWKIISWLGLSGSWRLPFTIDANRLFSSYLGAVIGLAASEAAYMAEIARAGILSVDRGQTEAAQALGMSPRRTMTRIVLPQALRIIVPPTGNETVAMLKDTSLLTGLPLTVEMFYQLEQIGSRTFQVIPVLMGALLYYLAASSVLMIIQYFVERRLGRGYGSAGRARSRRRPVLRDVREPA